MCKCIVVVIIIVSSILLTCFGMCVFFVLFVCFCVYLCVCMCMYCIFCCSRRSLYAVRSTLLYKFHDYCSYLFALVSQPQFPIHFIYFSFVQHTTAFDGAYEWHYCGWMLALRLFAKHMHRRIYNIFGVWRRFCVCVSVHVCVGELGYYHKHMMDVQNTILEEYGNLIALQLRAKFRHWSIALFFHLFIS